MSSRFAKLVQAQEERKVATSDSQLSTTSDSQLSTNVDSQIPPASLLSTTTQQPAIRQATRRKVDSHRRKRVDNRKGDRHRGDKLPYNNRVSEDTLNRIKHFIVDHDLEQQEFAELSAIHFMDAVESHQVEKVDSRLALDDRRLMMLFKTHPSIINIYLQYNPENRWKPADDYEGIKYNDKDIRLVELGIIQTQFNARFKKVNSFKYYATEIDIALETPLANETIEIMLKQGRRRWSEAMGREV
ncbi:MAG: hypothetical protein QOC99_1741 [Acidobacteriota bacterium]|nr:hypothetical protein [Acidobacteriota bacterium]MDT7779229.1 hypothetical protein [Acidobacteriota bacterium]